MAAGICKMSGWMRGNLELSAQTSPRLHADSFSLRGRGGMDRFRDDPARVLAGERGTNDRSRGAIPQGVRPPG